MKMKLDEAVFDKLAEITETSGNEIKTKIEKIFK